MDKSILSHPLAKKMKAIDREYSQRFIALDPKGYFIIKISKETNQIIVEHYSNDIDDKGRAIDPKTGQPLTCINSKKRIPIKTYQGRTAKEVGILLTEEKGQMPITYFDHALYLGRELQRAEQCLIHEIPYIQD